MSEKMAVFFRVSSAMNLLILLLVAVHVARANAGAGNIKRLAVRNRQFLWPAVYDKEGKVKRVLIPYTVKISSGWFSSGLGVKDKQIVENAAKQLARYTCIRFVKWVGQKDYIEIVKSARDVCESSIGRMGGKQQITLGSGCRDRGRIIHELMHALGFYHEHNRPDRDRFIRVLWQNIKKASRKEFMKFRLSQVSGLNDPYDFNSIMHYTNYEFSVNGKPTLQAIQNPNMKVGETKFPSSLDVMRINKLYRCPEAKTLVVSYQVTVVTGDKPWSGTDSRVFIELYGRHGGTATNSGELELYGKKDTFERNRTDRFLVLAPVLGTLTKMTVRHDNSGSKAAWYLSKINVLDVKRSKRYTFNCFCWLQGQVNTKTLYPS